MDTVSQKTKRQILLLGVDLIMKIKSEEKLDMNALKERVEYLKVNNIVKSTYSINDLIRDTCICSNIYEIQRPTEKSASKKSKKKSN